MHDSTVILDPTDEREPVSRPLAARPAALEGRVGIVDISKSRGDVFCDELDRLITARLPGVDIVRLRKPTYTKPAPAALRAEVASPLPGGSSGARGLRVLHVVQCARPGRVRSAGHPGGHGGVVGVR